mmetsp:Transcript_12212/g.51451  ORF Transcript_12212/g.51451 Transcript_12212/m.51451 type:complete len:378 (+) Transcript_12212:424-1557(+)
MPSRARSSLKAFAARCCRMSLSQSSPCACCSTSWARFFIRPRWTRSTCSRVRRSPLALGRRPSPRACGRRCAAPHSREQLRGSPRRRPPARTTPRMQTQLRATQRASCERRRARASARGWGRRGRLAWILGSSFWATAALVGSPRPWPTPKLAPTPPRPHRGTRTPWTRQRTVPRPLPVQRFCPCRRQRRWQQRRPRCARQWKAARSPRARCSSATARRLPLGATARHRSRCSSPSYRACARLLRILPLPAPIQWLTRACCSVMLAAPFCSASAPTRVRISCRAHRPRLQLPVVPRALRRSAAHHVLPRRTVQSVLPLLSRRSARSHAHHSMPQPTLMRLSMVRPMPRSRALWVLCATLRWRARRALLRSRVVSPTP